MSGRRPGNSLASHWISRSHSVQQRHRQPSKRRRQLSMSDDVACVDAGPDHLPVHNLGGVAGHDLADHLWIWRATSEYWLFFSCSAMTCGCRGPRCLKIRVGDKALGVCSEQSGRIGLQSCVSCQFCPRAEPSARSRAVNIGPTAGTPGATLLRPNGDGMSS
jgi:hypothetical protein